MGCFHGPNIEGTVCTRAAGTVSRAHPSGTICRILLLSPSLSTTGVSYMVLQETLVLQVPSALHTLPSTVCTRPAGAVSRAHPAETIWRMSFSLRSPPPGCRRHPRSADRRAPTMSPPLYLSVSFPTGIVSSCTPTVSGARYASSVVLQKRLVLHGGLGPTAIFPFHSGTCAGPLAPAPWRSFPRGAWRVFSLELVCS